VAEVESVDSASLSAGLSGGAPAVTVDSFARLLAADRVRFNAKFAEARQRHPRLEPEAFADLLRTTVAPLVEAVGQVCPEKTAEAAEALYDLALDLLGKELLGPHSRQPALAAAWHSLLPQLPRFVAEAPRWCVGAISNALYNLSATPGARPVEWVDALLQLAEVCPDVTTLLQAGQVAAWRAGLAHYRLDALEICTQLAASQPRAARLALGLPPDNPAPLEPILDGLLADPWRRPGAGADRLAKLGLVARVGAFRGFGGEFLAPPVAVAADGHLVIRDGENCWRLTADVFGATLHRVLPVQTRAQTTVPLAWQAVVGRRGLAAFPELRTLISIAADENTLAVTTALSHRVYLLARGGEER
jgi:hypothetical protein